MSIIFLVSVLLKGIGAALEVLIQIVITRAIGVSGFGTYSAWISAAELILWCLFSGLIKCNTFYLPETGATIRDFSRKYYTRYVLPLLAAGAAGAWLLGHGELLPVFVISLLLLLIQDFSSRFMARRRAVSALFGEYVLGRLLLLAGLLFLFRLGGKEMQAIVWLYVLQCLLVVLYYAVQRCKPAEPTVEKAVSLRKWARYQRGDIVQSFIGQVPILLQFFFVGAFEAGVVSVVLLVKRLINFISGPTAKVFLPEFSRLYKQGNQTGIRETFASIMRIQMLFVAPLSVVLVGFPRVILRILAPELTVHADLFVMCAIVFLVAATLGPCGGVMQMTGNERKDNMMREIALAAMFLVLFVMRRDPYFVLYGLCVQTAMEAGGKYIFVSRWMRRMPVSPLKYLCWWLAPAVLIAAAMLLKLGDSFAYMLLFAAIAFAVRAWRELKEEGLLRKMLLRR